MVEFADSTYVIVPATNWDTSTSELRHVRVWAEENNLKLNCSKSKESIFTSCGMRRKPVMIPSPCLDICNHSDKLTAVDHISSLRTSCSSPFYALRVLGTWRVLRTHCSCWSIRRPLTCSASSDQSSACGLASPTWSTKTNLASNDWARPPAAQSRPQLGVEACAGPFQVA